MPKARRLKILKGKDEQAAKDEKYREYLKREGVTVLERQRPPAVAQYGTCDFCGVRFLIEKNSAGIGCAVCRNVIDKLPYGASFILNAVIRRLSALEELRGIDENDINTLKQQLRLLDRRRARR